MGNTNHPNLVISSEKIRPESHCTHKSRNLQSAPKIPYQEENVFLNVPKTKNAFFSQAVIVQTKSEQDNSEPSCTAQGNQRQQEKKYGSDIENSTATNSQVIETEQPEDTIDLLFAQKRIFVYDWDDTFLCSTFLRQKSNKENQVDGQKQLYQSLDRNVCLILAASLKVGEVFIVTNSQEGWVAQSAKKLLPRTYNYIFNQQKNNIRVISCRPKIFENSNGNSALRRWKYATFKAIMDESLQEMKDVEVSNRKIQFIVVGDSIQEIQSGKQMYEQYHEAFNQFLLKTIKMKEFPSLGDLIDQQNLFLGKIDMITETKKKLSIRLQRPSGPKQ